jgi:ParB family chromosome partitioning protein
MVDDPQRQRLGRGLAALIGEAGDEPALGERLRRQRRVPIEALRANPNNPRRHFSELELEELSASIREKGILQPILVRAVAGVADAFEIIAGERRWRAAQRAGLHDVPVIAVEADDRQALELAIIENVQRADLNALEEARGYESLIGQFGYTQADLSRVVGKSRSHVANTLRLARLPEGVKALLADGKLSAGHARALLAVADPEAVAKRIVAQGLNVRDVERLAQRENEAPDAAPTSRRADKDADTRALEKVLADVLGLPVSIDHRGQGGSLKIGYRSLEQLDALCRRLRGAM